MKNIMEHMLTMIIMTLTLFVFACILFTEMQITTARSIHTSAVNQIQSSYYTVDIDEMNATLHEKYNQRDSSGNYMWNLSAYKVNSIKSRQDWVVTLDYAVYMPIFNRVKRGKIDGYAR